jgi:UDP-N-acetylglucosamine/UDP-N-acetyl-alpha-D-glucosaminouronate 4-epimerase
MRGEGAGKRVLVTGGAGFIGSHLVERLARDGYRVRVLDDFSTGRRENAAGLPSAVELIEGDVRSPERVGQAVRDCELVFHQAALPSVPRSIADPTTCDAVIAGGTLNVLLAARDEGVRRVILASSSSVYGESETLPKREDQAVHPISPYAVAKLAAEGYCRSFHRVYGLETVALRYFNVFGPRQDPASQYAAVIPRFILALLYGEPPVVFGDGEQSRDFTYVDDVVEANVLAASASGVAGLVLNAARGSRVSVNRLLAECREITGSKVPEARAAPRSGEVRDSEADASLARELLGFEPRVGLREGLERTAEHLRRATADASQSL